MNHQLLKTIIHDQHEVIRNFQIVQREYDFDPQANYVLVGLRRAGKSTLLYKIVQDLIASGTSWEQIIYINFEDERLAEFSLNDFNDLLAVQAEMTPQEGWFFLDEIQNVPSWEKFARRLADSKKHAFITGSNAKMLSMEIESTLGGRYLTKYITPYNFREYLTANQVNMARKTILSTKDSGEIQRHFATYFCYGGFPETLLLHNKREYVSSIYQRILLGDIAGRNGLRHTTGLQLLMKKTAEAVKDELSYSKLHNILKTIGLKISKDAIIDYIDYAKQAFLIFAVRNYFAKFIEKETTPKYYFNDNGLLNLFLNNGETRLLENLVALTLWKTYHEGVYYLKSNKLDIDFFVEETGTLFQVTYSLSDSSRSREIEALSEAAKTLPEARRFIILTYEEEEELSLNGVKIEILPVCKWLLQPTNTCY